MFLCARTIATAPPTAARTTINPSAVRPGLSFILSPRVSGWALSPRPSLFLSSHSLGSRGKASDSSTTPSPSLSGSMTSQAPLESVSTGTDEADRGSVRHITSLESVHVSPSSSLSALLPTPSPSVSIDSDVSRGKASSASGTRSLSSSGSSGSQALSASVSTGIELASMGSVPQFGSMVSDHPSPSSSSSALSPIESKSVSTHSVTSNWNMSSASGTPSLSSSSSMTSHVWSESKSSG